MKAACKMVPRYGKSMGAEAALNGKEELYRTGLRGVGSGVYVKYNYDTQKTKSLWERL